MASRTHGQALSPTYSTWIHMRSRCENPLNTAYHHYGGRGIAVCGRWQTFENFYADMGDRPPGHTLDRKDNDGSYTPENCRWATKREQCRNMRRTRWVTLDGVTKSLAEWCAGLGVNYDTALWRLRIGTRIDNGLPALPERVGAGASAAAASAEDQVILGLEPVRV
jgi:hypothetical protein